MGPQIERMAHMRARVDISTHLVVDTHHEAAQWPVAAADGEAARARGIDVIEPADDTLNIDLTPGAHVRCWSKASILARENQTISNPGMATTKLTT